MHLSRTRGLQKVTKQLPGVKSSKLYCTSECTGREDTALQFAFPPHLSPSLVGYLVPGLISLKHSNGVDSFRLHRDRYVAGIKSLLPFGAQKEFEAH